MSNCICGNCPSQRETRGLKPFCLIQPTASASKALYATKEQAEAANPNKRVFQLRHFNAPKVNFQNMWVSE